MIILAQHMDFNFLEKDFFTTSKDTVEKQILEDVSNFLSNKELVHFNEFRKLPNDYMEENLQKDGYQALLTFIKCNDGYVFGGHCGLEIHYKDNSNYNIFAVA